MKTLNWGIMILAAGLTWISASAQSAPTPSQDPNMRPSPTQPTQSQSDASATSRDSTMQGQAFTGTIVKGDDGYMLQNDTKSTAYKLDDAKMAKKFSGKSVRVTGSLDASSRTIHVTDIQAASTY